MKNCITCGSTETHEVQEELLMRYKKVQLKVFSKFTICGACGEEFESSDQADANDLVMREAKKKHDGLLGREELRKIRLSFKLTQQEAAIVFGGGINSFSKYERGEVSQSESLDKLIRLCYSDSFILRKHLQLINRVDLFRIKNPVCKVLDFVSDVEDMSLHYSKRNAVNNATHKILNSGISHYGT